MVHGAAYKIKSLESNHYVVHSRPLLIGKRMDAVNYVNMYYNVCCALGYNINIEIIYPRVHYSYKFAR